MAEFWLAEGKVIEGKTFWRDGTQKVKDLEIKMKLGLFKTY